ncbi:hypothetical protein [Pseudactinotalea terrae]|uniref:hypothetical protein n=1 Tax=Pseudactinotalea terrae TaxID=1743262 RepID=UPI0012E1495B|nr:hypothetical protein [Pseudactinotalea terrae]
MTTSFDTAAHPRVPTGISAGGQFATKPRTESGVQLTHAAIQVRIDASFPVPQANNLDAIASVPEIVAAGANTPSGVAAALGMADREGAYYGDAAGYLGLVEVEPGAPVKSYQLTDAGRALAEADPVSRAALMTAVIDEVPQVRALRSGDQQGVLDRLGADDGLGSTTAVRRLDTFRSWDRMTASPFELTDAVAAAADVAHANLGAAIQVSVSEVEQARRKNLERPVTYCGSCFLQLPASGSCDTCD